ncbi:hypothetical protein ABZX72_34240 [Streptomyces cyaneofuscatus]|uniref:hypothetical protein n=1 Tax=Streptomyces cyaneofuscatus TaxID=66883 RepID=UPI0033A28AB8
MRRGPVVDGWISTYFGWQRIVQESRFPGPVTVEAEAVMLRLRATSPAGLRDLIGGLVRKQHHNDADDMPPGVALTLGRLQLPDQWMRFVRDGWFAALTQDWRVATARLPEVPGPYERRDLSRLMEWLEQQPGLDRVRDAFAGTDPELVDDAGPSLRYGDPSVADLAERVALGRLLHLYAWALRHGDQPVVELVGDLRHLRDGRQ